VEKNTKLFKSSKFLNHVEIHQALILSHR